jgi:outer membrane lipoprotein-sorting protein
MKFLVSIILLVLPVCMVFGQENELLSRVREKLDKVNDYKAQGRMTIDVSFIDASPSNVTVYYKKPDKFKVKKEGGISILPKGGVNVNLGSLLSENKFDVVPAKDAIVNGQSLKVVKLLPTDENSDMVLATLYIEERSALVRKAVVNTRESGSYEIELSYGKYADWALPDKMIFSFNAKDYKMPKGITFEYDKGDKKEEKAKGQKGKVEISYSSYIINKGIDDSIFTKE